jgi:cytochrome c-type biogenesis protein CcsB
MSSLEMQKSQTTPLHFITVPLQWLASLKLAVVLLVVLAIVLAVATFIEKWQGHAYAQWYVYHSYWFMALLGLLALNILAAALVRYPWGRARSGFLLAHAGLLILLAGAITTFMGGVDGTISFSEGQTAREILLPDSCRITTTWPQSEGAQSDMAGVFVFRPGPVKWPEGKSLDLGGMGGVALKVLRYYPCAQVEESWQAAAGKDGPAALELAILAPDGREMDRTWLVSRLFGGQISFGPIEFELNRAGADSLVEDFLNPPATDEMDKDGVLSLHYEGHIQRIAVSENIGKRIPVDQNGISVEIAEYLPNAQPGAGGKFTSSGKEALNPMLELRVYLPGKETPLRQIAFARHPFLSLDVIHGWTCPVKFWYHHQSIVAPDGVEFLQTPDGKLYCRIGEEGKYRPYGQVDKNDEIDLAGQFKVRLLRHLPSARRLVTFSPLANAAGEAEAGEAAALVEVNAEGNAQQVWLWRNDREFGRRQINTPDGPLTLTFGYEFVPLEFSLKLLRFTHGLNPGKMGDASFASRVRLVDQRARIDQEREISMNQPLIHEKYVFYQSSYADLPDGKKVSFLSVAYDPGRGLKHLGCILVCAGTFVMFYMRSPWTKKLFRFFRLSRVNEVADNRDANKSTSPTMQMVLLAAISFFAGGAAAFSDQPAAFDWNAWRLIPVQDGGRYKPLDTLAWETARLLGNRTSAADPETGQKLDYTALYLNLLFQGEEQSESPDGATPPTTEYLQLRRPDKWDRAPLLLVDYPELRKALGLTENRKYFSPLELSKARFVDARTGQQSPLLLKAQQIINQKQRRRSFLDQKIIELADAYWTYRGLRMGKGLKIIPIKDSPHDEWMSVEELLRSEFDDSDDPTGLLRKAQAQFQQVREAFRANDPKGFNAASATLMGTLAELGRHAGAYPDQSVIALEVAYNRWAPFRFAWIFTGVAFLFSLLAMGSHWKIFHRLAIASCIAGLLAIIVGFGMRTAISGFAPVTNMYESVVYLALGAVVLGLIFEWIYRRAYILAAATAIAAAALILADLSPAVLDPAIRPLQPVLRNNFWLVIHVMSITLSYAAFALALGIGNITLGYYLVGSKNQEAIAALSKFTYRVIQVGVLLLAIGTILGAVWAEYAWGRFWGWDPKEVWALITLLGYAALLHARYAGWMGKLGLAAASVGCFYLVMMAWYGVNFLVGTGLHSYGFGGGGQEYVFAALFVQFAYVAAAVLGASLRASLSADSGPQ